jgi:hypothetical protein
MTKQIPFFSWSEFGLAYEAFSLLCSPSDWLKNLGKLSDDLVSNLTLLSNNIIHIMDIGAGTGTTSRDIRRLLLQRHNMFSHWYLFEPDKDAHERLIYNMPSWGEILRTTLINNYLDCSIKYDVVLFCHSTYYIKHLEQIIQNIYEYKLNDNGLIIFFLMHENSPFFSKQLSNQSIGTTEDILNIAEKLNYSICSNKEVQIKFIWSNDLLDNEDFLLSITKFVLGSKDVSFSDIQHTIQHLEAINNEFIDNILIIRRN